MPYFTGRFDHHEFPLPATPLATELLRQTVAAPGTTRVLAPEAIYCICWSLTQSGT